MWYPWATWIPTPSAISHLHLHLLLQLLLLLHQDADMAQRISKCFVWITFGAGPGQEQKHLPHFHSPKSQPSTPNTQPPTSNFHFPSKWAGAFMAAIFGTSNWHLVPRLALVLPVSLYLCIFVPCLVPHSYVFNELCIPVSSHSLGFRLPIGGWNGG